MRSPSSSARAWWPALAALAATRVIVPLGALALDGRCRAPDGGLCGDGSAYYSTARAIVAGWRSLGAGLALVAVALLATAALAVRVWRARPGWRAGVVVAVALVLSACAAAAIARIGQVPAGAVGWPLLLSVPLLPLRAVHAAGQDGAFAVAVVLSLAANASTVVSTAYAGRHASGLRSVGLAAATAYAAWPGLVWLLAGSQAGANDTWRVEVGIHLYTEPLSTALVAGGAALSLAPRPTQLRLALAGVALGAAFAVRPSNGIVGVLVVAVVLARSGVGRAAAVAVGAAATLPPVVAFLPKRTGYDLRPVSDREGALFGSRYVWRSFGDSTLWNPRALAILVPVALLGALALRRRDAAVLLVGWTLSNAAFYAFARATSQHPRYLFASLPALLLLWCCGAAALLRRSRLPG